MIPSFKMWSNRLGRDTTYTIYFGLLLGQAGFNPFPDFDVGSLLTTAHNKKNYVFNEAASKDYFCINQGTKPGLCRDIK